MAAASHIRASEVESDVKKTCHKAEKILKCIMDLIPSPSVKIQIMGEIFCLRCKGKTLMRDVNKLFVFKSLLTQCPAIFYLHLKQNFPPII